MSVDSVETQSPNELHVQTKTGEIVKYQIVHVETSDETGNVETHSPNELHVQTETEETAKNQRVHVETSDEMGNVETGTLNQGPRHVETPTDPHVAMTSDIQSQPNSGTVVQPDTASNVNPNSFPDRAEARSPTPTPTPTPAPLQQCNGEICAIDKDIEIKLTPLRQLDIDI